MSGLWPLDDGHWVVADNRWDLAPPPSREPTVSVIIPYYEQPWQLELVLTALSMQTHPADLIEVIVADDGSRNAPDVAHHDLTVSVVRQPNNGFRAAAVRNLGAAAAGGEVLCFLDADTVPEPDYLSRATRLPAAVPDAVVVGRRRHADLSGWSPTRLRGWWDGAHVGPAVLEEPGWLVEAYTRTRNLLIPGWDAYKYLISAVLTCHRSMFVHAGGFDESFDRYGGEDWELANRMFMCGAVLAHVPDAVAWHDGPDWGLRAGPERTEVKNAEAQALAPLITDPAARTSGLRFRIPDVAVTLAVDGHTPASLQRTVASLLTGPQGIPLDHAIWLCGNGADEMLRVLGVCDTRVRTGLPDQEVVRRCRYTVHISGRVVVESGALGRVFADLGPGGAGAASVDVGADGSVTVHTSRARHRARRLTPYGWSEDTAIRALFGVNSLVGDDIGIRVVGDEPDLSW
ncbi:glycosyltransferase [Williamsia sterculiae]|uniref:N-terminal domain of galactosyltransferase n=1 Tax=Williamsia sterculiae TaxID=1344003 RepID=A0A1N7EPP0_9NOCA|nr:glycosyltransferase [Williamsia sterculiae]SIR90024.1 N-terminal domain of galactosyltransferase [Williamsia sterculiae]